MGKRLTRQQRDARVRLDRCGPTGKLRYRTQGAARHALKTLKAQRDHDPVREEQRAYRCWSCDGWHLTKQPYGAPRGDAAGGSRVAPPPERKEGKSTA